MAELTEHPAQCRIGILLYVCPKVYPDLRGVVTSRDRTVVNQGDFASETCRGNSGAHTGNTTADHYKVVITSIRRLCGKSTNLPAECLQGSHILGRNHLPIWTNPHRVTSAVEPGQVR